jgi:ATP-dependent Clp protease protease subunit
VARYTPVGIYDTMQYVNPDVANDLHRPRGLMGAVLLRGRRAEQRFGSTPAMIQQPSGGARKQSSDIRLRPQT